MLEAQGLRKSYGSRVVVDDLSLAVGAGEIVGLLGPNGAGKSTTVAMLCGLVAADRGQRLHRRRRDAPRADASAARAKRRIGVVPQELSIYENLGAAANLELFGALYGLARRAAARARRRGARAGRPRRPRQATSRRPSAAA